VTAVYVALGDSMSIDDYAGGTGRGAASLLYRNRDTDFPDWAGRDLATAGYALQLLARDGATSTDVLVGELNQTLAAIARRRGAIVADVHGRFLGSGTAAGDPAQSDPRPANRDLWYCGVVEPNAWGAAEIRHAWWLALHDTIGRLAGTGFGP
jgi:hypothetical protein